MDAVSFVRADEQIPPTMAGPMVPVIIDARPITGHWINTNLSTPGIARVIVARGDENLSVQIVTASGPTPRDWGIANVDVVYSNGIGSPAATAFVAAYDFGDLEARVEANLSLGLLVVAAFITFKDGSGRSNFFGREFFYRSEEPSGEERCA
jgi:hypothetical protein